MGPIERALDLLRSAGVVEVTLRVDLGRGVVLSPLAASEPPPPPSPVHRAVDAALAAVADEFSHTGARVTRDAPPRSDDEEGDDADED